MNVDSTSSQFETRWPHRLAVLLVVMTYPLIWVGGLVTTTKSGMAVPDWPSTYGYNMFLYPVSTWFFGPFDLFIEHGHRLLASLVGLTCILFLAVAVWRRDRTLIWLGVIALLVVLSQGILGGLRVVADKTTVARIHGCVGPLCLAFMVYMESATSARWHQIKKQLNSSQWLAHLGTLFVVVAFLQIVFGSFLRHIPLGMSFGAFRHAVIAHVVTAVVVALGAVVLAAASWRFRKSAPGYLRIALGLNALVLIQIALGIAAWTLKYGWPTFLPPAPMFSNLLVQWESWLQSFIVTGHVAVGSLILGLGVTFASYAWKQFPVSVRNQAKSTARSFQEVPA